MTDVSGRVTEKTMSGQECVATGVDGGDNGIELSWLRNVKSLILPLCLYEHWQTT